MKYDPKFELRVDHRGNYYITRVRQDNVVFNGEDHIGIYYFAPITRAYIDKHISDKLSKEFIKKTSILIENKTNPTLFIRFIE